LFLFLLGFYASSDILFCHSTDVIISTFCSVVECISLLLGLFIAVLAIFCCLLEVERWLGEMSGKASSSQPSAGLSRSSALSHVYIQYPPLRCNISGSRGLFYDDGNKLILSPTSNQVIRKTFNEVFVYLFSKKRSIHLLASARVNPFFIKLNI
jgi:hypothetical protein